MAQVVEHQPSIGKALGSIPSTAKKKKECASKKARYTTACSVIAPPPFPLQESNPTIRFPLHTFRVSLWMTFVGVSKGAQYKGSLQP
jgi:hypothetical protein